MYVKVTGIVYIRIHHSQRIWQRLYTSIHGRLLHWWLAVSALIFGSIASYGMASGNVCSSFCMYTEHVTIGSATGYLSVPWTGMRKQLAAFGMCCKHSTPALLLGCAELLKPESNLPVTIRMEALLGDKSHHPQVLLPDCVQDVDIKHAHSHAKHDVTCHAGFTDDSTVETSDPSQDGNVKQATVLSNAVLACAMSVSMQLLLCHES